MRRRSLLLSAAFALTACTGTISGNRAGGNTTGGAAGATGAGGSSLPPDTMIAPPGMMPMPVDPTSPDAASTCVPSIAPAPVRRLSYAEYQATTKDLLGALKTSDTLLLRDPTAHGFENQATLLNPSPTLVEQYGDGQIAEIVMTKLFPVAMACDLTRVGLQHHTQLPADALGAPSGLDVHQDIAHQAGDINSQAAGWMVNYHKIHAQQFSDMVTAFKSVPEGSGTMLDNTILIWMNELANGGHDLYRMMYVIAGGKNLGFRPGRYLKYAEMGPNPYNLLKTSPYGDTPQGNYGSSKFGLGPAHSQLLVSIMQAFGVNRDSIGLAAATGTGYLRGMPVAMTGTLPRLT